jgi:hypothetical protein
MADELERIWKEAIVAYSRYNFSTCPEGLKKPTKKSEQVVS